MHALILGFMHFGKRILQFLFLYNMYFEMFNIILSIDFWGKSMIDIRSGDINFSSFHSLAVQCVLVRTFVTQAFDVMDVNKMERFSGL